jgi:hypothetical protein
MSVSIFSNKVFFLRVCVLFTLVSNAVTQSVDYRIM